MHKSDNLNKTIVEFDLYCDNFKNWWEEELSNLNFHCILINYDLKSKYLIESNDFYIVEPKITNKSKISSLIYKKLVGVCGKKYYVRRYYKNSKWLFKSSNRSNSQQILKYLKNYNFANSFIIKSLNRFLNIFLDYPIKFDTNGIILIPINKKLLIYIDYHGSVIFASESKLTIDDLLKEFSKLKFTILQR
ncbi:MAG: hypothetical protein IAE65_13170 [Ignavibacteria bacterium]|nr:hypothetical protein [Ignavibacteria bacterium]